MTEKELLAISECLKQYRGILSGYKINIFWYHKDPVYDATLSESQRVVIWQLILIYFGPNIQHIAGVYNIVAYTLSILPSMTSKKYKSCTRKSRCRENDLFAIGRVENTEAFSH